jgi:hypothetical protein
MDDLVHLDPPELQDNEVHLDYQEQPVYQDSQE